MSEQHQVWFFSPSHENHESSHEPFFPNGFDKGPENQKELFQNMMLA